jgi:hypothetical protein
MEQHHDQTVHPRQMLQDGHDLFTTEHDR